MFLSHDFSRLPQMHSLLAGYTPCGRAGWKCGLTIHNLKTPWQQRAWMQDAWQTLWAGGFMTKCILCLPVWYCLAEGCEYENNNILTENVSFKGIYMYDPYIVIIVRVNRGIAISCHKGSIFNCAEAELSCASKDKKDVRCKHPIIGMQENIMLYFSVELVIEFNFPSRRILIGLYFPLKTNT